MKNTNEKISEIAKKEFKQAVTDLLDQSFWTQYNAELFDEIDRCVDVEMSAEDNCQKIGLRLTFRNDWFEKEWFFDLESEFKKTFSPENEYYQEGLLKRAEIIERIAIFLRETAKTAPKFSNKHNDTHHPR